LSTPAIRKASVRDLGENPRFRALLAAASNATGPALDALVQEILDMELLVALDGHGAPTALAVHRRLDLHAVEIEYLAVEPALRHSGVATALVRRVRDISGAMVVARTDEEALGFYLALRHPPGRRTSPRSPG
jgi:ribosomal protein S18 acetylase RimI-like enzyme